MSAASADLRELIKDLNEAGDRVTQSAHQILTDTASQVQAIATSMAPRKTGVLASSIDITWHGINEVSIGPTVDYGVYQEFGTGSRGEFPGQPYEITPKRGAYLVFEINGRKVFAKKVMHPGIPAHPYMRPALLQALGPAVQQLADSGALQIVHG